MNFIGPFKRILRGNRYIFYTIDYFSRYLQADVTVDANCSNVINYLKGQFSRFPLLIVIYCDRGHYFNNFEMKIFLDLTGVLLVFSPSGASKSTDMIERGNWILKEILTRGLEEWDNNLTKNIYTVNGRIIQHLRYSPNEI